MTEEKKELTLFTLSNKERQEAINNLLSGRTPIGEIKERPMRGGGTANYVNTYYMTRQIGLITGFRWKSECLEERILDKEIGAKIRVTIYDTESNAYSQECWGQKDIARYNKDDLKGSYKTGDQISVFDDLKAAYSDGIKKCLSYFGIANDIYGGKELEYFSDDSTSAVSMDDNKAKRAFNKYLEDNGIAYSKVFEILNIKSLGEVTDFKIAYNKVKEATEK